MNSFKDFLQEHVDGKKDATIKFRSVEGGVSTIKTHILTLETEGGRDMITTDAGFSIGLDQIIEVNGRVAENIC